MWSSVPSFLRRHKKKLLFLGGVVGGVALLNAYLRRKFVEWEAKQTAEICEQLKRSNHFEGTMMTCDSVYLTWVPKIRQVVVKTIDVNAIVKEVGSNPPNKVQLWEKLKVYVFTQSLGEMYAQCLLCMLMKVQMSIMSGYAITNLNSKAWAADQQKKYLSRIEDFLLNGVEMLLSSVQKGVEDVLSCVPLVQSLKLQDVERLIISMQNSILHAKSNGSSFLHDVSKYFMPVSCSSSDQDEFLDMVSLETKDVIECQDFGRALQACIDCGVSSLMDRLSECYVILGDGNEGFMNPNEFKIPLPKLIPIMHNVFCQHQPTEQGSLVHTLLQLEAVNNFAANIYEAFCQVPS